MEATETDAPALTLVNGGLCDTRSLRQWSQDAEYYEYEGAVVPGQVWRLGTERYMIVTIGGMKGLDYILLGLRTLAAQGITSKCVIPLEPLDFADLVKRWSAEVQDCPECLFGKEES